MGRGGGKGTYLRKYLIIYFLKYNNNIFLKNWKFNLTESVTIGSLAAAWANRRQPDPPIGAARIIPHILESVALHFPFLLLLLLLLLPPPYLTANQELLRLINQPMAMISTQWPVTTPPTLRGRSSRFISREMQRSTV